MALPEELELELEALRFTYEDMVEVQAGEPAIVSMKVAPRTDGGGEHELFVGGRLVMAVPPSYPSQPPEVQLVDAKGLGDQRLAGLQAALAAEAASLAGELQLGHLIETTLDLLTSSNQPEGSCAFCLEPLLPGGASDGAPGQGQGQGPAAAAVVEPGSLLRLGCYHCYHMACFAPWWQWQQRRLAQREAQLIEEYKSMAAMKLEEESIRREGGEGGGAHVLACPTCRAAVLPSSLAHAWQQLQAATADSWSGGDPSSGSGSSSSSSGRAALQELPAAQRQQLAAMQLRHEAVKKKQQACGGLVDASHSVSISDLQQAAAAAAAAQQQQQQEASSVTAQAANGASSGRGGRGGRGGQHLGRGQGAGGRQHHQQRQHGSSGRGGGNGAAPVEAMGALHLGAQNSHQPQAPGQAGGQSAAAPPKQQQQQRPGARQGAPRQQPPPAPQQQQKAPGGRHRGGRGGGGGGRGSRPTVAPAAPIGTAPASGS